MIKTADGRIEEPLIAARDPTQMTTFKEFYPYYLTEHKKPLTKFMHCCGTCVACCFILGLLYYVALAAFLFFYLLFLGPSGSFTAYLSKSTVENNDQSFHLDCFVSMMGKCVLGGLVGGYSFAWLSHAFVEKNRPVTLKSLRCAGFSLLGDFRMCYECLILRKHDIAFWKSSE